MASPHSQDKTDKSDNNTQIQPHTHSFIVKVWQEQAAADPRSRALRGQLTHVPSGERYHFTRLDAIPALIAPFFEGYHEAEPHEPAAFYSRIWRWFHNP